MVLVWFVIALALLAVELHHLALFAVFGAGGAGAAALVAWVTPWSIPVQVAVAVAVAAVGVVVVRPNMSRAFAHRGPGVSIAGVHGGLVGATGVTLDEVGRLDGHVRLLGETWLAVAVDAGPIAVGTHVFVVGVEGTTLKVRALDSWELT